MKIYFNASGRGIEEFGKHYQEITSILNKAGHDVIGKELTEELVKEFYDGDHDTHVTRYETAMSSIKKADLVVLEVSTHSLTMGFLMQKALELNKPVIALYLKGYDPRFAEGIKNDKLQVLEYEPDYLSEVLQYGLDYASDQQDTRFNFFISPKHQNYLDWIAKERKIPRSVFLRRLIEKHMEENKDYHA